MKGRFEDQMDYASEMITGLQELLLNIGEMQKGLELGLLQQYLDDEGLSIKQVPHDESNICRAIADALYLTQSQHELVFRKYLKRLIALADNSELSSLLIMMTSKNTAAYIKSLKNGRNVQPEVDVVLMSLLFDLDIRLFYLTEEGIVQSRYSFAPSSSSSKRPVHLFLDSDKQQQRD